jgi:hypothetical protein
VTQQPLATLIPEAQQILLDAGQPATAIHGQPGRTSARAAPAAGDPGVHGRARQRDGPTIRDTIRELLDAVGETDQFDLVATLAFPCRPTHPG